ncbi:MAG: potassium channel protein [Bacteroidales bacterium]|nr:potassium channel protein [Bacteroidales bacterium]
MLNNQYGQIARYAKLRYASLLMLVVISIGTSGYMAFEDLEFVNALYLSVITISTVGFSDALITTTEGKLFTILLIMIGWSGFAYAISVITSHFVEGGMGNIIHKYRHKNLLRKMKNHTILVGYGRNGKQAAEELNKRGSEFVIIEKVHELIISSLSKNIEFVEGDATEDEVLKEAEIEKAKSIIITLPLDADNLFVTITARSLNPKIQIITRASSESAEKKLLIAGADEVVMPEYVGGSHMAAMVSSVDVVRFLDHISLSGEADTNLVEIECGDLPENMINQTIFELGVRTKSGANIIGFKAPNGEIVTNPTPDTSILPGSKLFVLGDPNQISKMKSMLKLKND